MFQESFLLGMCLGSPSNNCQGLLGGLSAGRLRELERCSWIGQCKGAEGLKVDFGHCGVQKEGDAGCWRGREVV